MSEEDDALVRDLFVLGIMERGEACIGVLSVGNWRTRTGKGRNDGGRFVCHDSLGSLSTNTPKGVHLSQRLALV